MSEPEASAPTNQTLPTVTVPADLQGLSRSQRKNVGRNRNRSKNKLKKSTNTTPAEAAPTTDVSRANAGESSPTNEVNPTNKPDSTNLPSTPPPVEVEIVEDSQAPGSQPSKRPVTAISAPDSPEYKRAPEPKRSKVIKLDNVPATSTEFKIKRKHRRKRGPNKKKNWRRNFARRATQAMQLIRACDTMGQPIHGSKAIDKLTDKEAIELAAGYRITSFDEGDPDERVYSFPIEEQGKRWRKEHGITLGQFAGEVMKNDDVHRYGFQVFDRGSIFGYGKDADGKEDLVFSAVFKPFAKMHEQEKKEVEFCGKHFTRLLDEGPYIDGNKAHNVPGAGE
ncbi:hypothetical protein FRC09_004254 [Ceratobasidium sp. 395]|nr:hypothetical protein FRC09_004254 [Ceratobasidium sp. 395]